MPGQTAVAAPSFAQKQLFMCIPVIAPLSVEPVSERLNKSDALTSRSLLCHLRYLRRPPTSATTILLSDPHKVPCIASVILVWPQRRERFGDNSPYASLAFRGTQFCRSFLGSPRVWLCSCAHKTAYYAGPRVRDSSQTSLSLARTRSLNVPRAGHNAQRTAWHEATAIDRPRYSP